MYRIQNKDKNPLLIWDHEFLSPWTQVHTVSTRIRRETVGGGHKGGFVTFISLGLLSYTFYGDIRSRSQSIKSFVYKVLSEKIKIKRSVFYSEVGETLCSDKPVINVKQDDGRTIMEIREFFFFLSRCINNWKLFDRTEVTYLWFKLNSLVFILVQLFWDNLERPYFLILNVCK